MTELCCNANRFAKPSGMPDALIRLSIYNLRTGKSLLLEFCFGDRLLRALEIKDFNTVNLIRKCYITVINTRGLQLFSSVKR
jgi:hypothetical protein